MFICLDKPSLQKELYFAMNKALTLQFNEQKIRGVYAIYKNNICLYVGQSSNVASRLATHLCGKYEECDRIVIFEDIEQTLDLIPSEKYLIQYLKPIENILADYSENIDINDLMQHFHDHALDAPLLSSYDIIVDKHTLFIHQYEVSLNLHEGLNMREYINQEMPK